MLITKAIPEHQTFRDSFRDYVYKQTEEEQRVRYTYVYADTQRQFVNRLIRGEDVTNTTSGALKVSVCHQKTGFYCQSSETVYQQIDMRGGGYKYHIGGTEGLFL